MNILTIISLTLSVLAIAAAITLWLQVTKLKTRFTNALGTDQSASLETTLSSHLQQVRTVSHRLGQLESEYQRLSAIASIASQKIAIIRFNPFGDTGGDQSFCLAVLDAHDSGYVLTSIHGRGGTRVYVKPIDFGKSKYPLSAEETQALTLAQKRVPQTPDNKKD